MLGGPWPTACKETANAVTSAQGDPEQNAGGAVLRLGTHGTPDSPRLHLVSSSDAPAFENCLHGWSGRALSGICSPRLQGPLRWAFGLRAESYPIDCGRQV